MSARVFVALSLAVLFAARPAVGQVPTAEPAPGYVVLASGDTLRGQVLPTIDINASRRVSIVPDGASEPRTVSAAEARAYVDGDGRRYVSRTVAAEFGEPPAAYFLRPLVEGQLDLLVLQYAPGDDRYFVQADGAAPEGLYVTRTVRPEQGVAEVQNRYRTTLARAFFGRPELQAETAELRLRARDLTRAVVRFNECAGAEATVAGGQAPRRSDVGISVTPRLGAGLAYVSQPPVEGAVRQDVREGARAPAQPAFPYVGLLAEFELRRFAWQSALTFELSLQQKSATPADYVFPGRPRPAADGLGTRYLVAAYGYRYTHGAATLAPYVGVGLAQGLVLDAPKSDDVFVPDGPRWEAGVFGELGAGLGPFTLGVRAERTALGTLSPIGVVVSRSPEGDTSPRNTAVTVTLGRRLAVR